MRIQWAVPGQAELVKGPAEVEPEQVAHPHHPGLPDCPTPSLTLSCNPDSHSIKTLPTPPHRQHRQSMLTVRAEESHVRYLVAYFGTRGMVGSFPLFSRLHRMTRMRRSTCGLFFLIGTIRSQAT